MSKTVEGTPVQTVKLTVEDLKTLGLGTVEELQTKLGRDDIADDTRVNLVEALTKAVESMTAATAAATEAKNREIDEDKFQELSKARFKEIFNALPADDPQRIEVKKALAAEFGAHNMELVLEGHSMTKALSAPITERNPKFDQIVSFRKAFDMTAMLASLYEGLRVDPTKWDTARYDPKVLKSAAERLKAEGLEGVDAVLKGINEALDTATAGEGLEWVPTAMSGQMVDDLYLQLRVASLFPRYTMPTKSFDLPIRTARGRAYRMAEATANNQFFTILATDHTFDTSKVTFTAEKLATLQFISDELDQDAILPVLQMMYEESVYGMADAIEDAVINGDTVTTSGHMDTTLWTGTADARGAWDGLRKLTQSGDKTDLSTFSLTTLRNVRKTMGKYGAVTTDGLAWVISPETHIELLKLGEVVTLEKFGPQATVFTGEIGRIDGIPVIVSPRIYTNLNASGVYDGVTTTKTVAVLVNRKGFAFGDRRTVRVETDRAPMSGQRFVLSTWRGDFQKLFESAESLVALGYNIAV